MGLKRVASGQLVVSAENREQLWRIFPRGFEGGWVG